jgi:hypothetical protein
MIAKIIKSGASFSKTANYLLDEKKLSADGTQKPKIIAIDGVSGDSANEMALDFEMQVLMNENVKNTVGHISLSFPPDDKDKLTDEFMVELAKEYMQKMKIENTPFAVVRHYDSNNPHCHILYSRVNNQGKVISDSNDRLRSVEISRTMEKEHGLTYREEKKNVNRKRLKGADALKYEIYDALEKCLPKCKDWEDLMLHLSEHDVGVFFNHRSGTDTKQGVIFEKDEKPFPGSKIDRKYSFANIEKSFSQNLKQSSVAAQKTEQKTQFVSQTVRAVVSPVVNILPKAVSAVGKIGGGLKFSGGGSMFSGGGSYAPVGDEEKRRKKKKKKGITYY